jgi:hypothetical protein
MKICPTCQSQYTDDTLQFCLQDGTRLQNAAASQMPTVAYGEQETVISNRPSSQINTPRETSPTGWQPNQFPSNSNLPTPEKKSNTPAAVFLTAFVMLLFFSLVGIGGWLFFKGATPDDNANLLLAKKSPDNEVMTNSSRTATRPLPMATVTPTTAANTSATIAPIDKEQIKTDVSQRLNSWKSAAESLDLDSFMSNYAATVDYYNKKGASVATVRADKQRAFTQYSVIKVTLSNISVTPDASGDRATAVFDKEWNFTGEESYSAGKVRQQLQLRKINGQWLITGEKDLKLYYKQ